MEPIQTGDAHQPRSAETHHQIEPRAARRTGYLAGKTVPFVRVPLLSARKIGYSSNCNRIFDCFFGNKFFRSSAFEFTSEDCIWSLSLSIATEHCLWTLHTWEVNHAKASVRARRESFEKVFCSQIYKQPDSLIANKRLRTLRNLEKFANSNTRNSPSESWRTAIKAVRFALSRFESLWFTWNRIRIVSWKQSKTVESVSNNFDA